MYACHSPKLSLTWHDLVSLHRWRTSFFWLCASFKNLKTPQLHNTGSATPTACCHQKGQPSSYPPLLRYPRADSTLHFGLPRSLEKNPSGANQLHFAGFYYSLYFVQHGKTGALYNETNLCANYLMSLYARAKKKGNCPHATTCAHIKNQKAIVIAVTRAVPVSQCLFLWPRCRPGYYICDPSKEIQKPDSDGNTQS